MIEQGGFLSVAGWQKQLTGGKQGSQNAALTMLDVALQHARRLWGEDGHWQTVGERWDENAVGGRPAFQVSNIFV